LNLDALIKNINYSNESNESNIKYFINNGNIYFKARDIAKILEYSDLNQTIRVNVDDDDKIVINEKLGIMYKSIEDFNKIEVKKQNLESHPPLMAYGGGGSDNGNDLILFKDHKLNSESSNTIFINESGLYSLILRSNKKEALLFKKWITSDLLPSIRKTGSYNVFDYSLFSNKNVFYLFRVKDKLYKFGITKNLKHRFNMHKTNKLLLSEDNIVKIYVLENYNKIMDIEQIFLKYLKTINIHREYNNGVEFFEINNINDILIELDSLIQKYNTSKIAIEENDIANKNLYFLQLQNENLKLTLKIKEVEETKEIKLKELESNIRLKELELEILKEKNKCKTKQIELDTEVIKTMKTKKCLDCDNLISNNADRCTTCVHKFRLIESINKTKRPSYAVLLKDLKELKSYVQVGKKYKVSDNTIRKWIKKYENNKLVNPITV
jgi:prophage antirepressor-like protein